MRVHTSHYDEAAEAFIVRIDGRPVVVSPAAGRPIEPVAVKEIAVEIEGTLWVAYPSQVDGDESTHLVIVIGSLDTGEKVAPVLVSEPLTHLVASDHLELAGNAWDPINELQAGVAFGVDERRS